LLFCCDFISNVTLSYDYEDAEDEDDATSQPFLPRETTLDEASKYVIKMANNEFCCKICGSKYTSLAGAKGHVLGVHTFSAGPLYCKPCNSSFSTPRRFLNHKKRHANGKFNCRKCGLSFKNGEELKEHYAKNPKCKDEKKARVEVIPKNDESSEEESE
jgi:hypothetical protein